MNVHGITITDEQIEAGFAAMVPARGIDYFEAYDIQRALIAAGVSTELQGGMHANRRQRACDIIASALLQKQRKAGKITNDGRGHWRPITGKSAIVLTLESMGFECWETGGGCQAMVRILPDGNQVAVTALDGCQLPVDDDWLIGRYPNEDWQPDGSRSWPTEPDTIATLPFQKAIDEAIASPTLIVPAANGQTA